MACKKCKSNFDELVLYSLIKPERLFLKNQRTEGLVLRMRPYIPNIKFRGAEGDPSETRYLVTVCSLSSNSESNLNLTLQEEKYTIIL